MSTLDSKEANKPNNESESEIISLSLSLDSLHGFLDNCRSYHFLAPFLVSKLEDAQVVALDLPGHGLSTHKPLDHPPMMIINDYCYYVAEFVQKLNWEDGFILIGHSLGAAISVIYAATCSQQVTKLVLLVGYGPDSYECG